MRQITSFFISIICIIFSQQSNAQISGCTDPQANNYNSQATLNDGSCTYSPTTYTPYNIIPLDQRISESSGLVAYEDILFTINDSGNQPMIYHINAKTGAIVDSTRVVNANNIDWEAITRDEHHLYIGDVGNNTGSRRDLKILKCSIAEVINSNVVSADIISYVFPDQQFFVPSLSNTPFDCEAIFYANDSLHLLTKDWVNNSTTLYTIPNTPGHYIAHKKGTFQTNGLVTDVAYDSTTQNIVLLGYQIQSLGFYTSFAWLLFDYQQGDIFSGNKRRINLGSVLNLGQTEGIALFNSGEGYISGEKLVQSSVGINEPAKLSRFNFLTFFNINNKIGKEKLYSTINIRTNPVHNNIKLSKNENGIYRIYSMTGQLIKSDQLNNTSTINVEDISGGHYFLLIKNYPPIFFIKP